MALSTAAATRSPFPASRHLRTAIRRETSMRSYSPAKAARRRALSCPAWSTRARWSSTARPRSPSPVNAAVARMSSCCKASRQRCSFASAAWSRRLRRSADACAMAARRARSCGPLSSSSRPTMARRRRRGRCRLRSPLSTLARRKRARMKLLTSGASGVKALSSFPAPCVLYLVILICSLLTWFHLIVQRRPSASPYPPHHL